MTPLETFADALQCDDIHAQIAAGIIGDQAQIEGPYGAKPLIYADYVASGRALGQIEDFIRAQVLPYYANSHTQASYCGSYITRLREAARARIAALTGAGDGCSVVFTGSGATAGINRIVSLLDIAEIQRRGGRSVVLIGPYEHHSNLLPWRESGAEVIEIEEAAGGGPDLAALKEALLSAQGADLIVGAFSAASNVTGIITDTDAVTRLLKAHGALAIWDYGCAGPYLPMEMKSGTDAAKDAIVFSTHKFVGGPGGSGVTVIRDEIARRQRPSQPGGGTVSFVSPWGHRYAERLTAREEGGTPNVIGDIRAALAMMVKDALGAEWLAARQDALYQRALDAWSAHPRIEILGHANASQRLPIFSFRIRDTQGNLVHHQLFTRMLSDVHGIQARGGCACAGSYAHRLLGLDEAQSAATFAAINRGAETEKPGWVRLNFSALMTESKVKAILDGVSHLATHAADFARDYKVDPATARFTCKRMRAA